MKLFVLLAVVFLMNSAVSTAQINLIGCTPNHLSGHTDIVTWEAGDSASVIKYPTVLQGYLLCSSVFDAWNSNYYLTGVTAVSQGLLSFNSLTNNQTFSNFTNFSNISEIDMSTGKIYTITSDSAEYFSVNQYDILTGTDSVIGIVHEPGMTGIVVDATGFDSNNGILYYVGYNDAGANCLYKLYVREPVFSYIKTTIQTSAPENTFQCLNYDNTNNLLYALLHEYDSSGTSLPSKIVEINTNTGAMITHGEFTGITGHQVGSSAFDQQTGSFLLIGVTGNFQLNLLIFNTITNTLQTGFLPEGVSELVCDNHNYAQATYGTSSIADETGDRYHLYPNPATDKINLSFPAGVSGGEIRILGLTGNELIRQYFINHAGLIDISNLKSGIYIAEINDKNGCTRIKVLKR